MDGDLETIRSFTLVTEGGETLLFRPAPEADRPEFPLVHLRDHLLSGVPVVVSYELHDGVNVAISLDDA